MKKGCSFGTHRVIEPTGALPQNAEKIDNSTTIWPNEILIGVDTLNIDSASFSQMRAACKDDGQKIAEMIRSIVLTRGKLQNPVTGSGGMLLGRVLEIGEELRGRDLLPGDKIATLVSLSLTPLKIDEILSIKLDSDQVDIRGKAVLFESGIYCKLPADIPEKVALAVLDVAGAPAQVKRLVKPGMTVTIIGGGGKSGILCCQQARKSAGDSGRVIAIENSESSAERLRLLKLADKVLIADATDPIAVYSLVRDTTSGKMSDVVINNVNVPNTEMASVLATKDRGTVYFFSMATSFTKAALGAEGVGKDIDMMIGNGYAKGHAELALEIIRENREIRELFEKIYV